MADPSRRGFLSGLGGIIAAPAIVSFASLMPVRGIVAEWPLMLDGVPIYFDNPRMIDLLQARMRSAEDILRETFTRHLFAETESHWNGFFLLGNDLHD